MKLSGHTKPFAVLGHPIGHTLSPIMHNAAFAALSMDAVYLAFDIAPARLMNVLPIMGDMGFRGVNLTIPLKEVAFEGLSDLDASARAFGAVNTIEFLPSGLRGHNTDGHGFLQALRDAFDATVTGRSIFILGCGGAGRAVALTSASEGAGRMILTDADPARARRVADEIRDRLGFRGAVETIDSNPTFWAAACGTADLVIQATPIGMKPEDPSLLPPGAFLRHQFVFDLIYMYPETPFMKAARLAGVRCANGLGMLLHQGARAFSIWTGQPAPVEAMRKALEEAVYGVKPHA